MPNKRQIVHSSKFDLPVYIQNLEVSFVRYISNDFREGGAINEHYGHVICDKYLSIMLEYISHMASDVFAANAFDNSKEVEAKERRLCQDSAIANCERLFHTLNVVTLIFHKQIRNTEKYMIIAQDIDEIKQKIKAWRSSDQRQKANES